MGGNPYPTATDNPDQGYYTSVDPHAKTSPGWDSGPVYDLGNSFITFGNTLYDNGTAIQNAVIGFASTGSQNGTGWNGWAAASVPPAVQQLVLQAQTVANQCWVTGEVINWYAMLRDQQEQTMAAEMARNDLLMILSTIIGLVLMFVPGGFLGIIDEMVTALLGDLVVVADRIVADAVGFLSGGVYKSLPEFVSSAEEVLAQSTLGKLG